MRWLKLYSSYRNDDLRLVHDDDRRLLQHARLCACSKELQPWRNTHRNQMRLQRLQHALCRRMQQTERGCCGRDARRSWKATWELPNCVMGSGTLSYETLALPAWDV